MDYTQSDQFATHAGTGQRMHQEAGPVPTAVSQKDMNSVMWSLMEVVKAGGRSGVQFDPDTPASYQQLLIALQSMITTASGDIPGRVNVFMQSTAPLGWLPMTGLLLSRTTYPSLWAHVQTVGAVTEAEWNEGRWGWFSAGDGSTTFRIPDLRAMVLRGLDDGRGIDLARVLGSYQASQNLAHGHTLAVDAAGEHGHTLTVDAVGGHGHTITVDAVGNHNHSNGVFTRLLQPPYAGSLTGGDSTGSGSEQAVGADDSADMLDAGGHAHTASAANGGGHAHTATAANGGSHTHTGSTSSNGGAEARVANIALPFYLKY